jgi:hypothetical protein
MSANVVPSKAKSLIFCGGRIAQKQAATVGNGEQDNRDLPKFWTAEI